MVLTVSILSTQIPNLIKDLTKILPNITFHQVQAANAGADSTFKSSEIIVCDGDQLAHHINDLPNVKLVQLTWAGIEKITPFITKPPNFRVARFSGDHFGKIMSEYVVASIVNYERDIYRIKTNQSNSKWVQDEGTIHDYRTIYDLTIGVLGTGQIGSRIGATLHYMGSKVLAYGRRPNLPPTSEFSYVAKYFTNETLADFVTECDYIINVLPKTNETNGLLHNVLSYCSGAVFINVGRSNVLAEGELLKALDKGWLTAAVLDVFDVEPLPADHPFWVHEKINISPHVAGSSRSVDLAVHFKKTLEMYLEGKSIPTEVDFTRGY